MHLFPTRPSDRRLAASLLLASLFSIILLAIRTLLSPEPSYVFLFWNLCLAWIPLVCAWFIFQTKTPLSRWRMTWVVMLLWLIFFPNAPYILTDLGHLASVDQWGTLPVGYDVVMVLTFTLTGLFLGFVSLFMIERVWRRTLRSSVATSLSVVTLVLAGFGMYVGRYLRWNSWDVFHAPQLLFHELIVRVTNPLAHSITWGFTAVYSGFLLVIYVCVRWWWDGMCAPVRKQASGIKTPRSTLKAATKTGDRAIHVRRRVKRRRSHA